MTTQASISALVVDNNLMSRQTLATILRQSIQLKDIYQSSSARDALSILRQQQKVDWIFAEAELPDQDAFEFLSETKKLESSKESSIIMVSSTTSRELLLKAASMGIADFIKKPFTANTLTIKLKRLVEGQAQRKSPRVALFEAITAELRFPSLTAQSLVVDISAGGCLVKCEAGIAAKIYDTAMINISANGEPIAVEAELVRMERHQEGGENKVLVAFQFKSSSDATLKQLSRLLALIKAETTGNS